MKKQLITISLVLGLMAGCGGEADNKTADIALKTIQCGMCSDKIASGLDKLEGVVKVDVDLEKKVGKVVYKAGVIDLSVIEKAIDKAKGGGGEDFAPALYEGFGPGGCMILVECLTDNPNRTFGDVRLCFTKNKCKLGTPGTVKHLFDHSAIFVFKGDDEDAALEALMDADVDVSDIESEDGMITVFAPNTEYGKPKKH